MTTVRTVAAHEVVRAVYPRPVTERDEIGMAAGKAIDETLSRYTYEYSQSRRPTRASMERLAAEVLDRELLDADLTLSPEDRASQLAGITGVIHAFRRSELMGLTRPRSRLILVNGRAGIYAQPDYWDSQARFYEMKSYLVRPVPPEIGLQLQLFQCAFPRLRAFLACFDRHSDPVVTSIEEMPPLVPAVRDRVLGLAYATALEKGVEKVLEYVDSPRIPYTIAEPVGTR
jgi:hypothetical protein